MFTCVLALLHLALAQPTEESLRATLAASPKLTEFAKLPIHLTPEADPVHWQEMTGMVATPPVERPLVMQRICDSHELKVAFEALGANDYQARPDTLIAAQGGLQRLLPGVDGRVWRYACVDVRGQTRHLELVFDAAGSRVAVGREAKLSTSLLWGHTFDAPAGRAPTLVRKASGNNSFVQLLDTRAAARAVTALTVDYDERQRPTRVAGHDMTGVLFCSGTCDERAVPAAQRAEDYAYVSAADGTVAEDRLLTLLPLADAAALVAASQAYDAVVAAERQRVRQRVGACRAAYLEAVARRLKESHTCTEVWSAGGGAADALSSEVLPESGGGVTVAITGRGLCVRPDDASLIRATWRVRAAPADLTTCALTIRSFEADPLPGTTVVKGAEDR